MEYKGKTLRNELKYIIGYTDYLSLKTRLAAMLPNDAHSENGGYHVRSLYFDDMYHTAFFEKADGIELRQKYRVRIYNKSDSVIKLERKEKYGSHIAKQVLEINRNEFYALTQKGDIGFLLHTEEPMPKDMYWAVKTRLLAPAVIVDYTREVFTMNEGNVRLSFDQQLKAGINTSDIFSSDIITVNTLEPGTVVLEVKYDDYLPVTVRKLLQIPAHRREAVSKFVYCRAAQFRLNPAAQYIPQFSDKIKRAQSICV